LHAYKELHSFPTIHNAMVIGERHVHHWSNYYLTIDNHRALFNLVHTQNCRLRPVQNWCGEQRTKHPSIRYGKCPTLQLRQRQRVVACFLRKVGNLLLDFSKTLAIGISQHRNNQSLFRANGDSNIVIMLQHQFIALDFRVQTRKGFERSNHRFGEEGHEAKRYIMPFLERPLTPTTHFHNSAHVYLIKGSEHCRRLLRFYKTLSNCLPPPREPNTLFTAWLLRLRKSSRCRSCCW